MTPTLLLLYHAILKDVADGAAFHPQDRAYALGVEEWRRQLDCIAQRVGFVLSPQMLDDDTVASGNAPAYDEDASTLRVMLTFDDAWAQHADVALPELDARGWRAAAFIAPGQVDAPQMLSWDGVRTLATAGWTIGSHGMTHCFLRTLPDAVLRDELVRSRGTLEERLGVPVTWLSLPGGRGDARVLAAAREAGYDRVFGSMPGLIDEATVLLPRCVIRADGGAEALMRLLNDPQSETDRLAQRTRRLERFKAIFGDGLYHWLHRQWMRCAGSIA